MAALTTTGSNVDRTALIERAKALLPILSNNASKADEIRRIPRENHDALMEAGLYRIYLPKRYGGYEMDQALQVDLGAELGRACGSTAWVLTVVASHSWMHGMFDEKAQDEVWGDDPDTLISGSTPTGDAEVEPVDGGYLLNGTWTFSSGVDVCQWNHFNMMTPTRDGARMEHRYGAARTSEVELIDDWHTTGLRGTGSRSMRCKDLYIPEYRTIRSEACRGEPTRGSAVNPGPIYRMPLFSLFGKGIVAPGIGIARGALDIVRGQMTSRKTQAGLKLAEQPTAQIRAAEAAAEIEAAWVLLNRDCEEVHAVAEAGDVPSLEARARWRRNDAFAGKLLVQAVDRLMALQGAGGNAEDSPLQRHFRDIHVVASHIALAWDAQGANYGRLLYGLPSFDPKI
jgi:3-hydroxy-9,10-secoandrosta-1,3,5(10)-triene-9,17-dione monooxygenase